MEIEDLIPHRKTMKLIDSIVEYGEGLAVTSSLVKDSWPLVTGGFGSPILAIELVAQTTGIYEGAKRFQENGKKQGGRGWLVGIKKADFFIDKIPVGAKLITRAERGFMHENYGEVQGSVKMDDKIIAEVMIQVFQATEDFNGGL
jgi:predicted hotdog family 3-hydroxylacyl-ACP dehydratase